jgi:hypothetical protein
VNSSVTFRFGMRRLSREIFVEFIILRKSPKILAMSEIEKDPEEEGTLRRGISGLGQKIIGEIETIGGVLTADPITQAEGEYNVEVGDLREEIEEDLEESRSHHRDTEAQSENE